MDSVSVILEAPKLIEVKAGKVTKLMAPTEDKAWTLRVDKMVNCSKEKVPVTVVNSLAVKVSNWVALKILRSP